jgi:lysozyme
MTLDTNGYKALHNREGLKLKPYLDTNGVPTIAMGNTYYLDGRRVTMKDRPLYPCEAEQLGNITADNFAKKVDALVTSKVNQNQFNALVSIAYNIGINGFAGSTFLSRVNRNPNDHNNASAIMMWVKDKELIGRRCSEVIQYFS